ncbi:hypothetical protein Lal_00040771 [Lupinus albus]|nr:hypothetical protein Lal_00040771 [Lupinus albus]
MIEIEDDLVVEILVRLPVKSLLRFKCVDKRWNDLFRKPTFAHRNMKMHEKKKKQCMVICEEREPPRIMISENYEVLESEWKNPFPDDHNVIWPMALRDTYNGFYAVTVGEQVPNPMFQDPTDDDYDRFTITYHPTSFGLYSLSTDTWTLMDFELRRQFKTTAYWNGFLFNGVLHWASIDGNGDCILRFDFRNNQFTTIDLPPIVHEYTDNSLRSMILFVMLNIALFPDWAYSC